MPFTPYHLGPTLLIGVIFFPFVDIIAILIGSIILDIEPFLLLTIGSGQPLHGISHTYLVATIVALLTTGIIWALRGPLYEILSIFRINQEPSIRKIGMSSILGTYSHVLMDSFLYTEMNPLFPIHGNPFLGLVSAVFIYQLCLYCSIAGIVIYIFRFLIKPQLVSKSNSSCRDTSNN
ncbi:MAG: hypothetical protein ACTSUB_06130 [Candidatus Thorarchaeota archaeon]